MKKLVSLLLVLVLACSFSFASAESVADIVKAAENLTHDELVAKALAETGTFTVYGNTSRITTAAEAFCQLYGLAAPASSNLKDNKIYDKLRTESKGDGADMVMIQDGASLKDFVEKAGLLVNYVPASVKANVAEGDLNPLVHQYIN